MHYLLFYEVEPGYVEGRKPFREKHLSLARQAYERGELILAGALDEPVDGAVLVFSGSAPGAAEAFVKSDPYVQNGLVKSWRVRKWNTVVGDGASSPWTRSAERQSSPSAG